VPSLSGPIKRLQEESRVYIIVNNSAADSHIFLQRHSPFLVYTFKYVFKNVEYSLVSD